MAGEREPSDDEEAVESAEGGSDTPSDSGSTPDPAEDASSDGEGSVDDASSDGEDPADDDAAQDDPEEGPPADGAAPDAADLPDPPTPPIPDWDEVEDDAPEVGNDASVDEESGSDPTDLEGPTASVVGEDASADHPPRGDSTAASDVASPFGGGLAGPEEDREMPLTEHIEEMMKRLAVVIAVAGLVTLLVFPFAEDVINFLWYSILPGVRSDIARPRLYGVLELVMTEIKVASLAGVIIGLPVVVYEAYAFMRPGLYPHERRYYLAAIPTSLVLAVVGASFAYFVILPAIFTYFLYYSQDVAAIGFALGRTFDLILLLMGYMAIVFQIPLFIMLAMMMNLVSREWLAGRRLLFWMGFLGVSFLFSPDPTGMAPIVVGATMIVLFEGTLLLSKWTGRG